MSLVPKKAGEKLDFIGNYHVQVWPSSAAQFVFNNGSPRGRHWPFSLIELPKAAKYYVFLVS